MHRWPWARSVWSIPFYFLITNFRRALYVFPKLDADERRLNHLRCRSSLMIICFHFQFCIHSSFFSKLWRLFKRAALSCMCLICLSNLVNQVPTNHCCSLTVMLILLIFCCCVSICICSFGIFVWWFVLDQILANSELPLLQMIISNNIH